MSDSTGRSLRSDERSVSELLGAILVFALILFLIVLAQVTLVPALNAQIEYEHSQRALDDVGDLQSSSSQVAATGSSELTNVEFGVTYPNRPLLLNPSPVTGVVETTEREEGVAIRNVDVPENAETDEYWSEATGPADRGVYDASVLTYEAQYNEHRGGGRTYVEGGTVAFTKYDSGDVVRGGGPSLVDGRRINLVVFGGDYRRATTGSDTVPLTPISAPSRTVSVTDDGEPIRITVTTFLSREQWEQRLAAEEFAAIDEANTTFSADPDAPSTLTVVLDAGETYELRMAKVGIGTGTDRAEAAYLTRERGDRGAVPSGGGDVAVDVRDGFNNPVSGTEVTFAVEDPATTDAELSNGTVTGDEVTVTSTETGAAVARLAGSDDTIAVTATIEVDGNENAKADYETVTFTVQIGSGDDGGASDAGEINPASPGSVVFIEATYPRPCQNGCPVDVSFRNTASDERTPVEIRINQFTLADPGASGSDRVSEAEVGGTTLEVRTGDFEPVTLDTITPNDIETYSIQFVDRDGSDHRWRADEWFIMTVLYDDGSRAVYLVNPVGV